MIQLMVTMRTQEAVIPPECFNLCAEWEVCPVSTGVTLGPVDDFQVLELVEVRGWYHLADAAFLAFVRLAVVLRTRNYFSINISRGVDTTCWWCLWSSRGLRCAGGLPCLFICAKLIDVAIFRNDPTAGLWFGVGRFRCSGFVAVAVARAGWSFFSAISTRKSSTAPLPVFMAMTLCTGAAVLNASQGNSFSREITSMQSG